MAGTTGSRPPTRGNRVIAATLLAALVVPLLVGCAALTGQRFTWFHDVAKDTFYLLIQYDGIHEGKGKRNAREQIPKFIEDGDIMILDWYGHLRRSTAGSKRKSEDPLDRGIAALYDRVRTEVLGRYREPADSQANRRCGAAQLVTIEKFQAFLRQANRLIDLALQQQDRERVVDQARKNGGPWRTLDRIHAAAAAGHTWISARGHALELNVPVHREEFLEVKGATILALAKEFAKQATGPQEIAVERLLRSLASNAFSYTESDDAVTLTLGDESRPRTLHVHLRDSYNTELEAVVTEHVRTDLDALLRQPATDRNREQTSDGWHKVRPWLPPEVEVGALLSHVGTSPPTEPTLARLRQIGARFNAAGGHPEAPDPTSLTPGSYLSRWKTWYDRRRRIRNPF